MRCRKRAIRPSVEQDIPELIRPQLRRFEARAQDRILEDLGAESMDIVNIIAAVEERLGLAVAEPDLLAIYTPADLADLVSRRSADA